MAGGVTQWQAHTSHPPHRLLELSQCLQPGQLALWHGESRWHSYDEGTEGAVGLCKSLCEAVFNGLGVQRHGMKMHRKQLSLHHLLPEQLLTVTDTTHLIIAIFK